MWPVPMVGRSEASALCTALSSQNTLKQGVNRKKRCFLPGATKSEGVKGQQPLLKFQICCTLTRRELLSDLHVGRVLLTTPSSVLGEGIKPQRDETTHSRSLLSPGCTESSQFCFGTSQAPFVRVC